MNQIACELLDPIMTPLVNKFYQQHNVRGRAKSHDKVWLIKIDNQIAATAKLTLKEKHFLLTGVFTVPLHRGKYLASQLIKHISSYYQQPIYTFAYSHLVDWYTRCAFNLCEPPPELQSIFQAYVRQGRDIRCMVTNLEL